MIIALGFSPDQSRQINHLAAGRGSGEGQEKTIEARITGLTEARRRKILGENAAWFYNL